MLKQEGFDLMGAAFEVYNVVGYGMAEEIYQQGWKLNSDRGPSRTVARRTLSWRMGAKLRPPFMARPACV